MWLKQTEQKGTMCEIRLEKGTGARPFRVYLDPAKHFSLYFKSKCHDQILTLKGPLDYIMDKRVNEGKKWIQGFR